MKYRLFAFALLGAGLLFSCTRAKDEGLEIGMPSPEYNKIKEPPVIPPNQDSQYKDHGENPFVKVADEAVSTFSVDADGASYANVRRFIRSGVEIPRGAVRIEEFLNYFTFDYAEPQTGEHIALNSELATCPWNKEHHLLRLGMKGLSIPKEELPNSNYVFLIDVSGSMGGENKLDVLKQGFKMLVDNLREQDRVSIVTYSGRVQTLIDSKYGDDKEEIKSAIDKLYAAGSTAGGQAMVDAYALAEKNFILNGNNRIILGTDGDFNVGVSSTEALLEMVEQKRESGIYLTVLGVGSNNLMDHRMEQIADKGNGNYEYIDNVGQMEKIFVKELYKFYTVAKDSKIQISFNPNMVDSYRLIGYENRALNNQDFEDDEKDAGEVATGQTITAVYELVLKDTSAKEQYAQFDFRYKKPNERASRLLQHSAKTAPVELSSASENMRFATALVGFGLLTKNSIYKGSLKKEEVLELAQGAISFDPNNYRKQFIDLLLEWRE